MVDYIDRAWEFLLNFKDNDNESNNNESNNNESNNNESNNNESNNNESNNNESNNSESNNSKSNNNESNNNESNNSESNNSESNNSEQFNKKKIENTNILKFINKTGKTTKGEEYNRYYSKCFLNINCPTINGSSNNYCKNCKEDNFEIDSKNGIIICTNCGSCEQYYDYSVNGINYNDFNHIETSSQPFSYQRKNHFKEWLNQLQGKEVTIIPDSVINLILLEIKKERVIKSDEITSERIKKYLKKLKLNKYYEHIPNLISKITNKPPLTITKDFEEILLELFDKIQEPFKKHCPKNRKNF